MTVSMRAGQVITFYSYKGGTGRSMALANVACLLAEHDPAGKGILMVDWDLEAPGLQRFFQGRLRLPGVTALLADAELDDQPGLLELFEALATTLAEQPTLDEEAAEELFTAVQWQQFVLETDIPGLFMLKAGRFDASYAQRLNTFRWEELYNRAPWLMRRFAELLSATYQYTLIDSRTGVSDISNICTMLMPEKLVVVFTPNRQSLTGIMHLVRQATDYRRQSDDLRPLLVFPLPSRVELAEHELYDAWRMGNAERGITGYQPQFEQLFREVYDLPSCDLSAYFDEVQIQHVPYYAYGEEIAVLNERNRSSRLSLTRSYESFTRCLEQPHGPWEAFDSANSFDIVLIYDYLDLSEVERLAQALSDRGLRPWVDQWELLPGEERASFLVRAIERTRLVGLVISRANSFEWVSEDLRLVQQLFEDSPDKYVIIPIGLPGYSFRDVSIDFLRKFQPVLFKEVIDEPDTLNLLARSIRKWRRAKEHSLT